MPIYVALLRAVNVAGTGKLPMTQVKALCTELGLRRVETYIASGNVVFEARSSAQAVRAELEQCLSVRTGRSVGVFVRTADEMRRVLTDNPFADRAANRTYAFFLHDATTADSVRDVRGQSDEEIRAGRREIYVFYPAGMGRSKLRIPVAEQGTARNMNTVAKLAAMSARR
jgi:uncharacterized protein (DUF1697 family)